MLFRKKFATQTKLTVNEFLLEKLHRTRFKTLLECLGRFLNDKKIEKTECYRMISYTRN